MIAATREEQKMVSNLPFTLTQLLQAQALLMRALDKMSLGGIPEETDSSSRIIDSCVDIAIKIASEYPEYSAEHNPFYNDFLR